MAAGNVVPTEQFPEHGDDYGVQVDHVESLVKGCLHATIARAGVDAGRERPEQQPQ